MDFDPSTLRQAQDRQLRAGRLSHQDLDRLTSLLTPHVPTAALPYCLQLWQEKPFHFVLRRSRVTKLGDFSCKPGKVPRITVNADSHPFLFLITYVHEVAHLRVHQHCEWRVAPHGYEWKSTFRELCDPMIQLKVFPPDIETALVIHLQNPKASSLADPRLTRILRSHDTRLEMAVLLSELPEGTEFSIRNRRFSKGMVKRTRVLCRDLDTRRQYLISADAVVDTAA
jgi:SprT protein